MTTAAPPRPTLHVVALLAAAMRAYDRAHAVIACDACGASWTSAEAASWDVTEGATCRWCTTRAKANAEFILKPPAPRGYGYATDEDLAALGYDRDADRQQDLARWAQDMEMAVGAGIITEQEARVAWASQKN